MPLTAYERNMILEVARGSCNNADRHRAVAAHRRVIREQGYLRGTPEGRFMGEIDNPVPDLLLRARYREELLNPEKVK